MCSVVEDEKCVEAVGKLNHVVDIWHDELRSVLSQRQCVVPWQYGEWVDEQFKSLVECDTFLLLWSVFTTQEAGSATDVGLTRCGSCRYDACRIILKGYLLPVDIECACHYLFQFGMTFGCIGPLCQLAVHQLVGICLCGLSAPVLVLILASTNLTRA